jgi:hypothetical protein
MKYYTDWGEGPFDTRYEALEYAATKHFNDSDIVWSMLYDMSTDDLFAWLSKNKTMLEDFKRSFGATYSNTRLELASDYVYAEEDN